MGHAEPPHKRNAMSPALNNDMVDVLNTLEVDEDAGVVVLRCRRLVVAV